jgi:hypothetical protein
VSFYASTATFILLHCDEWDRVVALPRHKFVTGATLLQLCLGVCKQKAPLARGPSSCPKKCLRWILLMWCNVKFECALFRSDSRHNDRLDSLWGCAIKQAVLNSGIETKLLGGFWLLAKKCLRWIHAYVVQF